MTEVYLNFFFKFLYYIYCVRVCLWAHMDVFQHVEVRAQFAEVYLL